MSKYGVAISGEEIRSLQPLYDRLAKEMDELQQYRQIGTVEQVKNQKHNLGVAYKMIEEYQAIGTVEECRAAKEKQEPMKVTDIHVDEYYCPTCGSENNCDQGQIGDKYCPECGQAIN